MTHLQTLQFINIQGHKDTILELSEGLNVIKGSSHAGKSSLARGVEWLLFNRPLAPHEKIKHWSATKNQEMSVIAEFSDNSYVIRTYRSDFNGYIIGNNEGEKELEALRGDVPEEVQKVLGMNSVNYRGQDDGYFMFSDTPGEVARLFNKSAGLDIIDDVIGRVNSMSLANSEEISRKESQIKEETQTAQKLQFVKGLKPTINSLERKINRCNVLSKTITDVEACLNRIKKIEELKEKAQKVIKLKEDTFRIGLIIEEFEKEEATYTALSSSYESYKELQKVIEETKNWLKIKPKVALLKNTVEIYGKYSNAYAAITALENKRRTLLERIPKLKLQRDTKRKQLDYCPYCGASKEYWSIKS